MQPLTELVTYDPDLTRVVEFALQGLYICQNFDQCCSCSEISKNCDFATLEGELVDRHGVITSFITSKKQQFTFTGGTSKAGPTKWELFMQWKFMAKQMNILNGELLMLEQKREQTSKQCEDWYHQLSLVKAELEQMTCSTSKDSKDGQEEGEEDRIIHSMKRLNQYDEEILELKELLTNVENRLSCWLEERNFWQDQLDVHTSPVLIEERKRVADQLSAQVHEKLVAYRSILQERKLKQFELNRFKSDFIQLTHQKRQIKLAQLRKNVNKSQNHQAIEYLQKLRANFETHRSKYDGLNRQLTQEMEQAQALQEMMIAAKTHHDEACHKLAECEQQLQQQAAKLKSLEEQLLHWKVEAIKDDVLASAGGEYRHLKRYEEINQQLQSVNKKLKKLSNKATTLGSIQKFEELTRQHRQMTECLEKLENNMTSVNNFFQMVDLRKKEVVHRTYKQVSSTNVASIFNTLTFSRLTFTFKTFSVASSPMVDVVFVL